MVSTLLRLSGMETPGTPVQDEKVALEAAKVLSNLLHQSSVVQSYCSNNGFLSKILSKIQYHTTISIVNHQIKVFDFRLIFLFTALCPEQRDIAKHNHSGLEVLRDAIQKGILE